jgi:hypothetical protein
MDDLTPSFMEIDSHGTASFTFSGQDKEKGGRSGNTQARKKDRGKMYSRIKHLAFGYKPI